MATEGHTSHTYSDLEPEFLETDTIDLYYIDFTVQQNPVFFAELKHPMVQLMNICRIILCVLILSLPSYPSNFIWFYTNASGLSVL